MENLGLNISGVFTIYETKYPDMLLDILSQVEYRGERMWGFPCAPKKVIQNQILKNGLKLFLAPARGFYGAVTRIVAGNQVDPTASTFDTYQSIQSPLADLNFPKTNIVNISEITNGYQASFVFKRPRLSLAGVEITEMGLEVSNGVDFALLSRVIALPGQIIHQFSTTEDTIITYDLKFQVA